MHQLPEGSSSVHCVYLKVSPDDENVNVRPAVDLAGFLDRRVYCMQRPMTLIWLSVGSERNQRRLLTQPSTATRIVSAVVSVILKVRVWHQ